MCLPVRTTPKYCKSSPYFANLISSLQDNKRSIQFTSLPSFFHWQSRINAVYLIYHANSPKCRTNLYDTSAIIFFTTSGISVVYISRQIAFLNKRESGFYTWFTQESLFSLLATITHTSIWKERCDVKLIKLSRTQ